MSVNWRSEVRAPEYCWALLDIPEGSGVELIRVIPTFAADMTNPVNLRRLLEVCSVDLYSRMVSGDARAMDENLGYRVRYMPLNAGRPPTSYLSFAVDDVVLAQDRALGSGSLRTVAHIKEIQDSLTKMRTRVYASDLKTAIDRHVLFCDLLLHNNSSLRIM